MFSQTDGGSKKTAARTRTPVDFANRRPNPYTHIEHNFRLVERMLLALLLLLRLTARQGTALSCFQPGHERIIRYGNQTRLFRLNIPRFARRPFVLLLRVSIELRARSSTPCTSSFRLGCARDRRRDYFRASDTF